METAREIAVKDVLPSLDEYESLAIKGISSKFIEAVSELMGISESETIQFGFDKANKSNSAMTNSVTLPTFIKSWYPQQVEKQQL